MFKKSKTPLEEFIPCSSNFTSHFYSKIKDFLKENENFCFSPFNLQRFVSLLRVASKDETAHEIKTALFLPQNPKNIDKIAQTLNPILEKNTHISYSSTGCIVLNEDMPIKKDFKIFAAQNYGNSVYHVNFKNSPEAEEAINKWAGEATNGKILELVDQTDLKFINKLAMVTGAYFEGAFFKNARRDTISREVFYVNNGHSVEVEVMKKTGFYNYFENNHVRIVEMPFDEKMSTLTIILTNERYGLYAQEKNLTEFFIGPNYIQKRVNIVIPKFKINNKLTLKKPLQKLGMKKAFCEEADFSDLVVEHATFLDNIIETCSVNILESTLDNAPSGCKTWSRQKSFPSETIPFVVDHPFMYYIKVKDIILFAGRLINPGN